MKYCVGILLLALILAAPAGAQTTGLLFENGFEAGVNLPPVADAGLDQTAQVGQALMLDGSASWDPEGAPLGYAWRILERPDQSGALLFEADTAQPVLIADRAGLYRIELQVHDGALFSAPVTLEVQAAGALPAAAWVGPQGGAVGLDDGASVLIPPQALTQPQYIQIATTPLSSTAILPPTAVLAGAVYALQPGGLVFQRAAQITLPYRPEALPAGRSEGSIAIHRQGNWAQFDRVASQLGQDAADISSRSDGQIHHPESRAYTAWITRFSAYTALSVNHASEFAPQTLSGPNSRVVVRRPPTLRTQRPDSHKCIAGRQQGDIPLRTASQIQAIILHSTNNGNVGRDFNSELGWAADACNKYFAHYYIDRDGAIYQVADDLAIVSHSLENRGLKIKNDNAIGIELFLNVGEPYDGRQISALIRLTDYLMDKYALPRPQRQAETGLMLRQVADIEQGGDRVLAHADVDSGKCDPSGIFMNSGQVKPENANAGRCKNEQDERVTSKPLAVGDAQAPALIDIVLDAMAALDRSGQHTGLITTQGGDSYGVAPAGRGGHVQLREDAAQVSQHVGDAIRTHWQQNDGPNPALEHSGPGALIVGPGVERTLTGATHEHTDAIIAGTLTLNQDTELRLTGSFYLAPNGKIVIRNGRNGGRLTVYSRGTPIIQGLIDARGKNGVAATPEGGHGGDVAFYYSAPGLLLVPTIYTRGGDADIANVSLPVGGPSGGNGGNITLDTSASSAALSSQLLLGGGVGPIVGDTRIPAWHDETIDTALLTSRWAGDYLPPAPPTMRSSYSVITPVIGQRVPKTWGVDQPGFSRGLLTAGGMGGAGLGSSADSRNGGAAGHGGNITLKLGTGGILTFRDIDIATGMEIETLTHRFYLPGDDASINRRTCTGSGAHGGFGANREGRGGDGGPGGNAGSLTLSGGTLTPLPAVFALRYKIRGFPAGQRLQESDSFCSRGSQVIGQVLEARTQEDAPLYRVRLDNTGTRLLGGHGGIPSGIGTQGYPGNVGPMGAAAPVTGLPVQ